MTTSEVALADRPVRVHVLGGFVVEGVDEKALGTRKARVLLKRLAVAVGRPVPSDELAAAVWPEGLPKNPAQQVSVLVSRVRAVLGAHRLPRADAGYSFAADWFDLVELADQVAELDERLRAGESASALAAAQTVLRLASGTLLPEEDGDWVDEVRPGVERLVARGRLSAGHAALRAGELGAARAAAQSVLDGDPYDEAALRLVMRADALAGRPGAALAAYATVRHRLSEDLGADPAPETERLHTAIVRGELPAAPTSAPATVVGRDRELTVLDGLLRSAVEGATAAVVIEAEAGMGKSALLGAWQQTAARTALVISGRCDELGADLPLQPVIDGLVAHLEGIGRNGTEELLGPEERLLDPLLGRPSTSSRPTATSVTDVDAGRSELFAALAAVLRRAAADRPLVLVVDDLHQAAPGTAEFLAFCLRRMPAVTVVATRRPEPGPDLPGAPRLTLGPLSVEDAVALAGPVRGPLLHERSGGHPLFLQELATAGDDQLPDSLVAAVRDRLQHLGAAAVPVQVAASCGTEVDASLVAAISRAPIGEVLDGLEAAARGGLLRPRGAALVFSHELVREAIEASTSAPRRVEIHRAAVEELARRPDGDALALARHARLGGDRLVAARALAAAAEAARDRFEAATAEELLDQAIELHDTASARLARGRLRLARLDLAAAGEDGRQALELGAGVEGFELAGWTAYYGRDYDAALRYADEGVDRSVDAGLRASCLALAGRIRHTRGQLAEAGARFEEGVAIAPPGIRGMVQVWQAQLLAHQGEPARAVDVGRRGLLDPHLAHPFAWGHGRFAVAYAHGVAGQWLQALAAVDELDELVARQGDRRFPPVAANVRGWLLRGAGLLGRSAELHQFAAAADPGPTFQEARYAAWLDLAECHLAADDAAAAAAAVDTVRDVLDWTGSMSWRHQNRYQLLVARLASLDGRHADAATTARALAAAAADRGDPRYGCRGLLVAATAEARAGEPVDLPAVGGLVARFLPLCGPDGWRDLAELATATGSAQIWEQAERQAAAIVGQVASHPDLGDAGAPAAVRRQLERLGR